jgi:WD40 repeat protein
MNCFSVSHDQTLRIWSLDVNGDSYKCERVSLGHDRSVDCVQVDNEAVLLATGGSDNLLNIWSTGNFEILKSSNLLLNVKT